MIDLTDVENLLKIGISEMVKVKEGGININRRLTYISEMVSDVRNIVVNCKEIDDSIPEFSGQEFAFINICIGKVLYSILKSEKYACYDGISLKGNGRKEALERILEKAGGIEEVKKSD